MFSIEISEAGQYSDSKRIYRKNSLTSADVELVPRIGETLKLDLNDSTDNWLVVDVVHEIHYDRGQNTVDIDVLVIKAV